MLRSYAHRWLAPVLALAILGLAGTVPGAGAGDAPFHASGTFQVDWSQSHGTHFFINGQGRASPAGSFTTTVEAHDNFGNGDETGVQTLDFGHGDTLSIYFEDEWVPAPDYPAGGYRVGPYVVTGGTGRLAGASGGGTLTGIPNGDGTGAFYLDGALSR
jgi:hypothetical protein